MAVSVKLEDASNSESTKQENRPMLGSTESQGAKLSIKATTKEIIRGTPCA